MTEFKPGDMVECVKRSVRAPYPGETVAEPVLGGRYTVRGMVFASLGVCLLLEEIRNPPFNYSEGLSEPAFFASRFRLIKPPATDISIFREIVEREFHREPVKVTQ